MNKNKQTWGVKGLGLAAACVAGICCCGFGALLWPITWKSTHRLSLKSSSLEIESFKYVTSELYPILFIYLSSFFFLSGYLDARISDRIVDSLSGIL